MSPEAGPNPGLIYRCVNPSPKLLPPFLWEHSWVAQLHASPLLQKGRAAAPPETKAFYVRPGFFLFP